MKTAASAPHTTGFLNTRVVTALAIVALALSWNFLPDFAVVMLGYIGRYSIVAVGLVLLTGVGGMT